MKHLIEILFLMVLILCAALTAASEISIISASRLKLKRLALDGSRSAKIILKILETPERFFSTILISNNIVDTLIAVIVTAIVIRIMGDNGGRPLAIATILAAFLIIFAEVTAKSIAAKYSIRVARILARPMKWLIKILYPLVMGIEFIIGIIMRMIGGTETGKGSVVTDDEIKTMIKIGQAEGTLQKDKYKMITKVFDFSDTIIRNVMTQKENIMAINVNSGLDDTIERVLESGYSRIPVYKDNPENIIGIINMKDILMLSHNKGLVVLQDIIYPVTTVSEMKKVTELLTEFQKGHTHLAVVVDAENKLKGIVTLEDLIEEIVGEIEDESDVRSSNYKTKSV